MKRVLIVDDEKNIRLSLSTFLKVEGFDTLESEDGDSALIMLDKEDVDAVILDLVMPGKDGFETLKLIKKKYDQLPVIMLTAHASIDRAVEAMKLGAFDFLEKPPNPEAVAHRLRNALNLKELQDERKEQEFLATAKEKLIGNSLKMKELYSAIEKIAPLNTRVLICGESGTGKELVALAIHRMSLRKNERFVKVNCAAIPAELFESEFFGHEKGSYTGAITKKTGKFEKAHGGTLFLDEVGDIPLNLQPKILRAIQYGEIQRIGSDKEVYVDVRIIAATNKDLKKEVDENRFREDLFYRLHVFPIYVPPLREHKDDIPALIDYFVKQISTEDNFKPKTIDPSVISQLEHYDYPGNIRELRNIIERLLIISPADTITQLDLPNVLPLKPQDMIASDDLKSKVSFTEKKVIEDTLNKFNWNISQAAKYLGLERSHLYKKMHKLNITRK
jgi:two-component system, NtrC family, nitrogen regulation response regulator NtrX